MELGELARNFSNDPVLLVLHSGHLLNVKT